MNSSVIATSPIPMPPILVSPWETHQCAVPSQDCDWSSQYWNGLAC